MNLFRLFGAATVSHPTVEDEICIDDQRSSALLKGVPCGVLLPGENVRKTLTLQSTRAGGDRVLDISVQSRAGTDEHDEATDEGPDEQSKNEEHEATKADINDVLHTLTVPTAPPLDYSWSVRYARPEENMREPGDMTTYEPDAFDSDVAAYLMLSCTVPGPWDVELQSVQLDHSVRWRLSSHRGIILTSTRRTWALREPKAVLPRWTNFRWVRALSICCSYHFLILLSTSSR